MSLNFLLDEGPDNPHEIAWKSRDWAAVKELSKQFKKTEEQGLFEILNNVTRKTGYLSPDHFDDYNQHMINHALSQHVSMRGYAFELNLMEGLISDRMHYDYLYYGIRQCNLPRVKFAKVSDDWEQRALERLVARLYNVSHARACEYIDMFTDEQTAHIRSITKRTVTSGADPVLSFIPTKADREKIYRAITGW